jgi:DNA polymerase I
VVQHVSQTSNVSNLSDLIDGLHNHGVVRGTILGLIVSPLGIAIASPTGETWTLQTENPSTAAAAIESVIRPRWLWWTANDVAVLTDADVNLATCWDVAAVTRLIFGGWRWNVPQVWAALRGLPVDTIPTMGQLGLLEANVDEGDNLENPVRPDGHLRPEWTSGRWATSLERMAAWATICLSAYQLQLDALEKTPNPTSALTTARSESLAELMCAELERDGLPIDVACVESILEQSVGPRPHNEAERTRSRETRDELLLRHIPDGVPNDLRNPAHVRAMLRFVGVDVPDTRAWRLEAFKGTHPFVDALAAWRKAERLSTTYGYQWLDDHVGPDGRLRGSWSGSDGAAGRMTAQAGLHNLPAELRDAVRAEPGHVFVHVDLGQIEPRVLAAVSGDAALALAAQEDDMYAPVAARLGVDRPTAKVAVLGAMYGATSGVAGEALRGLEKAYPTAMSYLNAADQSGRAGIDIRTYGGRLVRMQPTQPNSSNVELRSAAAGQGRYARNALIQGAAAELFKAWAVTVRGRVVPFHARIVLCLHDELLIHTPVDHGDTVARIVEQALRDAARWWMPLGTVKYVAVATTIARWSDAK